MSNFSQHYLQKIRNNNNHITHNLAIDEDYNLILEVLGVNKISKLMQQIC